MDAWRQSFIDGQDWEIGSEDEEYSGFVMHGECGLGFDRI